MGNDFGMQYIMDGSGNYYTLNGNGQLVAAKGREEAGIFSLFEANRRIGGGKKSRFYQTVPVETRAMEEPEAVETEAAEKPVMVEGRIAEEPETVKTEAAEELETSEERITGEPKTAVVGTAENPVMVEGRIAEEPEAPGSSMPSNVYPLMNRTIAEKEVEGAQSELDQTASDKGGITIQPDRFLVSQPEFTYDMENINWKEFVGYFLFLAGGATAYLEELAKRSTEVDQEICDLLHYAELYDLTDAEELRAMDLLKDARMRRRRIKDEQTCVESFQRSIGTSGNAAKAKGFLTELKKLDSRKYHPRQLSDLFVGMSDRATDRELYRQRHAVPEIAEPEEAACFSNPAYYEEGADCNGEEMEMNYVETVFDTKENDWLGFAKQQLEFYRNADQYMINLQIEIRQLDQDIDVLLTEIDDVNYNVTQGYKALKELKDMRNDRKAKMRELDILRTMTECFDTQAMVETLEYNVSEIEGRMGE